MHDAPLESARVPGAAHDAERYRLKQLLDMQTELLGGIAHELNTPLNSIIGFAELLADGRVDPTSKEHKEFLNHILTGGRQLASLTKRLGDLSNLHSQRAWRVQPIVLQTLLKDVYATLRMTLMRRRVEIALELSPELGVLNADEIAVKQVIYGLLWNAIRATPEGQRVQLRAQPEGADKLRIEVEDPGHAIDEGALSYEIAAIEAIVSTHGGTAGANAQAGKARTLFAILPLGS